MSERQQLDRVLRIDREIRSGSYPNAASLACDLEVSLRVIFNDRTFLIDRLGAPLANSRSRGGWYYRDKTWALPHTFVTRGELLAFFLSVEIARRNLGGVLEAELRSVVQKMAHGLSSAVAVDLESLVSHLSVAAPSAADTDEHVLLALNDAIERCRRIKVRYYTASTGKRSTRTLEPHHLRYIGGDWYLIAFDCFHHELRTFHAGRISEMVELPEGFVPQPDFDAATWFANSFRAERGATSHDIAVRFEPAQAIYIRERRWHADQTIEELPDGSLILRWHSSGLGEIKRWVLQYGAQAEVLSPKELREAVADEVKGLARRYGG